MTEFIEDSEMVKIVFFKEWLLSNGATFDKIDWPSSNTVGMSNIAHRLVVQLLLHLQASGIRGGVALDDIQVRFCEMLQNDSDGK